jgi:hypothetical protein
MMLLAAWLAFDVSLAGKHFVTVMGQLMIKAVKETIGYLTFAYPLLKGSCEVQQRTVLA